MIYDFDYALILSYYIHRQIHFVNGLRQCYYIYFEDAIDLLHTMQNFGCDLDNLKFGLLQIIFRVQNLLDASNNLPYSEEGQKPYNRLMVGK